MTSSIRHAETRQRSDSGYFKDAPATDWDGETFALEQALSWSRTSAPGRSETDTGVTPGMVRSPHDCLITTRSGPWRMSALRRMKCANRSDRRLG